MGLDRLVWHSVYQSIRVLVLIVWALTVALGLEVRQKKKMQKLGAVIQIGKRQRNYCRKHLTVGDTVFKLAAQRSHFCAKRLFRY